MVRSRTATSEIFRDRVLDRRKPREADLELAKGQTTADVIRKLEITEQIYYRSRKEYDGLRLDQAKRLKELGKKNV